MIEYKTHVQERAMERFGVFLTIEQLNYIVTRIYEGDAEYIGRGRNNTTIWCIDHEGTKLYPLIDFENKFILTFLTKTMAYNTAKRQRLLVKNK